MLAETRSSLWYDQSINSASAVWRHLVNFAMHIGAEFCLKSPMTFLSICDFTNSLLSNFYSLKLFSIKIVKSQWDKNLTATSKKKKKNRYLYSMLFYVSKNIIRISDLKVTVWHFFLIKIFSRI